MVKTLWISVVVLSLCAVSCQTEPVSPWQQLDAEMRQEATDLRQKKTERDAKVERLAALSSAEQARLDADTSTRGIAFAEGYARARRVVAGWNASPIPDDAEYPPILVSLVEGEPYAVRLVIPAFKSAAENIDKTRQSWMRAANQVWCELGIDQARVYCELEGGDRIATATLEGVK